MKTEEKFEEWFKIVEDYPCYDCISKSLLRRIWDVAYNQGYYEGHDVGWDKCLEVESTKGKEY